MSFYIGTGCVPTAISNDCINRIARSNTPPEMNIWEKIKEFFCLTHQSETLDCIWKICHPPAGTTREDVVGRFEKLRTLAYPGFVSNIQSGRHGEDHFCILDENSREILSVAIYNAGACIVACDGLQTSHDLTLDIQKIEVCVETIEMESNVSWTSLAPATTATKTAKEYKAIWTEWKMAAPPEEAESCVRAVQRMCRCLQDTSELILDFDLLTSLPDYLPPGLTSLYINCPQLASLPPLPPELKTLGIESSQLASLPMLPPRLQKLLVDGPQLTSLPPLPPALRELSVYCPQLTSLPEGIARLPAAARVHLPGNARSEHILQAALTLVNTPGYSGPSISFDTRAPSDLGEPRALHLVVAEWLISEQEGVTGTIDRWKAFEQENNAASFSSFLDRLFDTENHQENPGFKAQISSWLALLAEDDELRAKTFAIAMESTSSCEDRVTLALNDMRNVQLVHNAEKGAFDNDLQALASAGRETFRLEKIEQIARERVKALTFVDEVDEVDEIGVYLGYQNRLRVCLELTTTTEEMRFFEVSGITESDLQAAAIKVKTAENSQFKDWILQWEPLHNVLKRIEPEQWESLSEKKTIDYEDAFQKSCTKLVELGLSCDTDAERIIGAEAMKSAENKFLDSLCPLVERLLGEHLDSRWSLTESGGLDQNRGLYETS